MILVIQVLCVCVYMRCGCARACTHTHINRERERERERERYLFIERSNKIVSFQALNKYIQFNKTCNNSRKITERLQNYRKKIRITKAGIDNLIFKILNTILKRYHKPIIYIT